MTEQNIGQGIIKDTLNPHPSSGGVNSDVLSHLRIADLGEIKRVERAGAERSLNSIFEDHLQTIRILRRDAGESEEEVEVYERTLPHPSNLRAVNKDGLDKYELIRSLSIDKQKLLIANFPEYIRIWGELDPESRDAAEATRKQFDESSDEGAKSELSSRTREQVERSINIKTMYYAEMMQALNIDSGMSFEDAERLAVEKSLALVGVSSIPEKTLILKSLKKEAIDLLLDTLEISIEVWEALYPGTGEDEEIRLHGNTEEERAKNAKHLYKKIAEELEKRRGEYRLRLTEKLTSVGINNIEATRDSVLSERELIRLSRIEQVQVMNSGNFI